MQLQTNKLLQFTYKKQQMLSSHERVQAQSQPNQESNSAGTTSNKISPALRQAMKRHRDKTTKRQITSSTHIQAINEQIRTCSICFNSIPQAEGNFCSCKHTQLFCSSCQHHYSIYKINSFQKVTCPQENCLEQIDTNSDLFKQLPKDVQDKCHKINIFYSTLLDPTIRHCPSVGCQGTIKMNIEASFICNLCKTQFCGKCLMKNHEGSCDQQEIDFFQQNLHYRQCMKCKMLIQKTGGCDHMVCRCSYQFCYVCQQPWSQAHRSGIHVTAEGRCVSVGKCFGFSIMILLIAFWLGFMLYGIIGSK